jgi:hypothetical protein
MEEFEIVESQNQGIVDKISSIQTEIVKQNEKILCIQTESTNNKTDYNNLKIQIDKLSERLECIIETQLKNSLKLETIQVRIRDLEINEKRIDEKIQNMQSEVDYLSINLL